MVQLGWIGLGNMGRGMVPNLVNKQPLDKPLLLFNRNNSKSNELAEKINGSEKKIEVASSIADLVQKSDVIFTCIANDAAIKETIKAAIDSGNIKGKLFVESSTVSPETTDELADLITKHGGKFCAAPVFGAPAMADSGALIFVLAANDDAIVDEVIPYTKGVMGRAYIDLRGQKPGHASLMKLSGNHLIMSMVLTLSESMVLASKSGIGEEKIVEFTQIMFGGGPYEAYAKRMISGDYASGDPKFQVDLALKDAGHMSDIAKANGIRLGTIEEAKRLLYVVKKEFGDTGDMAGMYGAIRVQSGLPFKKEKTD